MYFQMKIRKKTEGQTIIETALMLVLLLLILFGITEFSRAWYTKNSLKNAVRTGARVAVVTSGISSFSQEDCPTSNPCSSTNIVLDAVCCKSPGIKRSASNNTKVTLTIIDDNGISGLNAGDTISVSASTGFSTVVPGIMGSFIPSQISTDASMRYE